jgi:hypothetical protein
MNTATDIDAIESNADETIKALFRYRSDGAGESFRQYRDAVADMATGKPVDPQTLSRILQFAGKSIEQLLEDKKRAVGISRKKAAEIAAKRIAEQCAPIAEELRRMEAEFAEIRKIHEEKSEDLRFQIDQLQYELKQYAGVDQQLRSDAADRPECLKPSWTAEANDLGRERLRILHPLPEPSGPDVTKSQIKAWRESEKRRAERLESIDTWLAVCRRADELIRETYLCQVTGLWDPNGDSSKCLDAAHKEVAARQSARRAEIRADSIAAERAEEAADEAESDSDVPVSISTLFATANETMA